MTQAGRVVENPHADTDWIVVGALHDVVHDFPFETDAHNAAWVVALLTPLARFAFAGPSPMFVADANVRGAGKTLLSAALKILGGYTAAGRPDQRLKSWGSFAGWSDLVRGAVVWAGMADPGESRVTISESDPNTEALGTLLIAWQQADPNRRGLTAGEFVRIVQDPLAPDWTGTARAALDVLLDRLEARMLGNRLRSYRRRIVGGLFFDRAGERQRAIRWAAYPAEEFGRRPETTHETHKTQAPSGFFQSAVAEPGESGKCSESSSGANQQFGAASRQPAGASRCEFAGPCGERF